MRGACMSRGFAVGVAPADSISSGMYLCPLPVHTVQQKLTKKEKYFAFSLFAGPRFSTEPTFGTADSMNEWHDEQHTRRWS